MDHRLYKNRCGPRNLAAENTILYFYLNDLKFNVTLLNNIQRSDLVIFNDLAKVGFICAHSHISAFNNFLIICAIKLFFAYSNLRHHFSQSIKMAKYCFDGIFTCECPLNVQCSVLNKLIECRSPNVRI